MSALELQRVIVARLKADAGMDALVGDRIYDNVSENPTFPYVSIGPDQVLPDRADCYDGVEITLQLDAWSRKPGYEEAKQIAEAMRLALDDAPLVMTGHRLVELWFETIRVIRDPDGLTSHAIATFRALTEPV